MQFQELGTENEKTMLFLFGTACSRQVNFHNVIDELPKQYHPICVNCDGFKGDIAAVLLSTIILVTGNNNKNLWA